MIWEIREGIAAACRKYGFCLNYELSLTSEYYYDLVEKTRELIANDPDLKST